VSTSAIISWVTFFEVFLDPVEIVTGELAVFLEVLELLAHMTPHVPNRNPAFLGPGLHDLHELLAADRR